MAGSSGLQGNAQPVRRKSAAIVVPRPNRGHAVSRDSGGTDRLPEKGCARDTFGSSPLGETQSVPLRDSASDERSLKRSYLNLMRFRHFKRRQHFAIKAS